MCLKFLGTITYALDQTSLGGTEYFAVQANGDFYVKNGIEAFSTGQALTINGTATDSGMVLPL